MKKLKSLVYLVVATMVLSVVFTACEENPEVTPQEDILPNEFGIDIPASISSAVVAQGGRLSGRTNEDTLQGNDIYLNLGTFIAIGDGAAEIVEEIIIGLKKHKIDRVISLSFISDDDQRVKNLTVSSDVELTGKLWEYMLIVTDAESEGNDDGGKAMQIFWNHRKPFEGIAILKPFNIDRNGTFDVGQAIFRIDYTQVSDKGYDAEMEVQISGLPLASPLDDPYSISTIHMWAGKKGEIVDVRGNSSHPNAVFISGDVGFNWAFVASGSDPKELGVAEVGLPPDDLDVSDRDVLLKDYSIEAVFTNEINAVWPTLEPALVANFLVNTQAPGYFSNKVGFIVGGESPGSAWDVYEARLPSLSPFNPLETSNLIVSFQ